MNITYFSKNNIFCKNNLLNKLGCNENESYYFIIMLAILLYY